MKVFYDPRMLQHRIPAGIFDSFPSPLLAKQIEHPEGPDRILNTVSVLQQAPLADRIHWGQPVIADDSAILSFHNAEYLEQLKAADRTGEYLCASTYLPQGGLEIARLAAGAVISALEYVTSGEGKIGYAMCRPPNHHAQPGCADGYCFINAIGIAALQAIAQGYKKIAVIDWDVHHGNGTQAGFYQRDDVLTISMHMDHGAWGESHLQTGKVDEIGEAAGTGFNVNLPLPFGSGDRLYNDVFARCVVPLVRQYQPDLIILANGQDANQFDPNGRQMLTMNGFYRLAQQLRELAWQVCEGRILMTQEGGYNPTYAPLCAYSVVAGLLGEALDIEDPIAFYPENPARADRDLEELIAAHPLLQA